MNSLILSIQRLYITDRDIHYPFLIYWYQLYYVSLTVSPPQKMSKALAKTCLCCGNAKFVACPNCNGSRKSSIHHFKFNSVALRCIKCDKNDGLVPCPICHGRNHMNETDIGRGGQVSADKDTITRTGSAAKTATSLWLDDNNNNETTNGWLVWCLE